MRIVDAQLHEPPIALDWSGLVDLEQRRQVLSEVLVGYLDAVGVDAAVLFPADAAWAESLAALVPQRFGVVTAFAPGSRLAGFTPAGAIGGLDPFLDDVAERIAEYAARPSCAGFRMMRRTTVRGADPGLTSAALYRAALTACEEHGVAVFMSAADALGDVPELCEEYPDLVLVLDHLALPQPPTHAADDPPFAGAAGVLRLARYLRLHVKLSGAPTLSRERFPYRDLWPHVRQYVDAFGADRLMWGSDISRVDGRIGYDLRVAEPGYAGRHTYAQSLYYLLETDLLHDDERAAVLGGTADRVLRLDR